MRGLQGLRQCELHDRVWGVVHPEVVKLQDGFADFDKGAVPYAGILPATLRPFARSVGSVAAREQPPTYQDGFLVPMFPGSLPHEPPDGSPQPIDALDQYTLDSHLICSRAVYLDGEQRWVVYPYSGDDAWAYNMHAMNVIDVRDKSVHISWGSVNDASLIRGPVYGGTFIGVNGFSGQHFAPNQIGFGREYFVRSGYNTVQLTGWSIQRWKYGEQGGYVTIDCHSLPADTGVDESIAWILYPSIRTYLRSTAPQPDEPWCIAIQRTTGRMWTGRWLNTSGGWLEPDEREHEVTHPGAPTQAGVVCYNRVDGVDLIVIDVPSVGRYLYDGTAWRSVPPTTSYVTRDWDGNLYYGSSDYVTRDGPDGWTLNASGGGTYDPVESTFQILPTHRAIQLRGFADRGQLASGPINTAAAGVSYELDFDDTPTDAGSSYILNWTISFDGTVRIPHLHDDVYDATGFVPPGVRYLRSRAYSHRPRTDWFSALWGRKTKWFDRLFLPYYDYLDDGLSPMTSTSEFGDCDVVDTPDDCGHVRLAAYY